MVYTILISIVFVAELIIAVTVVQNLLRLDKLVVELDETIAEAKKGIYDIACLSRKISEQFVTISKQFVDDTKRNGEDALFKSLSKILLSFILVKLNLKFINKMRKSKITKILVKGYSFIENMV